MPVFKLTPVENHIQPQQNVIIEPTTPNSCPNCNTIITCGCQWMQASDGRRVCDECYDEYESKLSNQEIKAEPVYTQEKSQPTTSNVNLVQSDMTTRKFGTPGPHVATLTIDGIEYTFTGNSLQEVQMMVEEKSNEILAQKKI